LAPLQWRVRRVRSRTNTRLPAQGAIENERRGDPVDEVAGERAEVNAERVTRGPVREPHRRNREVVVERPDDGAEEQAVPETEPPASEESENRPAGGTRPEVDELPGPSFGPAAKRTAKDTLHESPGNDFGDRFLPVRGKSRRLGSVAGGDRLQDLRRPELRLGERHDRRPGRARERALPGAHHRAQSRIQLDRHDPRLGTPRGAGIPVVRRLATTTGP